MIRLQVVDEQIVQLPPVQDVVQVLQQLAAGGPVHGVDVYTRQCSLFISRNTCSAVGCCCSSVTAANISSAYFGILRPSKIRTILILVFHYTHIRPVVNSLSLIHI